MASKTLYFAEAVRRLEAGKKVRRDGWSDKEKHLFIIHLSKPVLCMKDGEDPNTATVGWTPSPADALAEDWRVVE